MSKDKKNCFLWHKWGKWKDVDAGDILREDNSIKGKYIVQERRCEICNKVQLRWEKLK